jgi:gluconate kinase
MMVDWCYVGNRRFTEPFFEQTINALLRHPFNLLFRHQTPIDGLAELQAVQPGVPPAGFIFHMSRCGSTLIAQLLAALPQCIVLSEAGPIDTVVRAHHHDPGISDDQRCVWLRGLLDALAQRRHEQEQHLVVKFDSWNIMDLPIIRRAFPTVPWVFVYRDPLEVLVSHSRQRGSQMVPGIIDPRVFGFNPAAIAHLSLDEYGAQVLGKLCQAAAEHLQAGTGQLVAYRHLPELVWSALLDVFGVEHSAGDVERMRHAARWHAKNPSLHFAKDTAAKQAAGTDELRRLAAQWVEPAYTRLRSFDHTLGTQA